MPHTGHVVVDQVATRGPYRWVRHPSYTGLLLIALGFGLGVGNWLSLAICAVIPLVGLVPRIAVEEAELARVLGDPYRSYQKATRRLVPGLWEAAGADPAAGARPAWQAGTHDCDRRSHTGGPAALRTPAAHRRRPTRCADPERYPGGRHARPYRWPRGGV